MITQELRDSVLHSEGRDWLREYSEAVELEGRNEEADQQTLSRHLKDASYN
jgi:hypothetical protein